MAEFAIAASVLSIVDVGVRLVENLYRFGSSASAARQQTAHIASRINDYTDILEILGGVLEQDSSLMSAKATSMVEKLCTQSEDLFYDVDKLLPSRDRSGRVRLKDKIAWNFRKPKVELLLGQIEYVKSNVGLLIKIALLGENIRKRSSHSSLNWTNH